MHQGYPSSSYAPSGLSDSSRPMAANGYVNGDAGVPSSRSKKSSVTLRPRANSGALSVNLALANNSASSSYAYPSATASSSSAYNPSTLSQRPAPSLIHPHTPTFSSVFPATPPATPNPRPASSGAAPAFWQSAAAAIGGAGGGGGRGDGLGISTAKDDGVKGWLKGAASGTTVWLTPGADKHNKRRVSDGILSPQAEAYNARFGDRDVSRSLWSRLLRRGPQTPAGRLVALVCLLLLGYHLLFSSPRTSAPVHPTAKLHARHTSPTFRQTYSDIPDEHSYDSLRVHDPRDLPSAAAAAGAVGRAGWTWKDSREELGCLLHYVTSSGNAALPDLDPDEPLDPQLILDFNPYSQAKGARNGRRMVEQTVDDFWNGKSTLGGGKVVIVGKQSDPASMSIRAVLEDLEIDTQNVFISVEGRSDTYQLHRLLERIISVPRLPALIIGGKPIGSYLQMMSLLYSGELYTALDDAGIKYVKAQEEDEVYEEGWEEVGAKGQEDLDHDVGDQWERGRPW